jgi:hypothetical protein
MSYEWHFKATVWSLWTPELIQMSGKFARRLEFWPSLERHVGSVIIILCFQLTMVISMWALEQVVYLSTTLLVMTLIVVWRRGRHTDVSTELGSYVDSYKVGWFNSITPIKYGGKCEWYIYIKSCKTGCSRNKFSVCWTCDWQQWFLAAPNRKYETKKNLTFTYWIPFSAQ